uniref:hypothetical protein n=1 Tax=Psychrobacter sp. TaxID=56811 RepID=UPI0015EFAFB8|nr:hypothetical protein [Psychrobacter sp.]
MPLANAETWIKLNIADTYINKIDRDSIRKEGDFAYYTMKFDYDNETFMLKFKHDCKYNARKIIRHSKINKQNNEVVFYDSLSGELNEYERPAAMIKLENMVCR